MYKFNYDSFKKEFIKNGEIKYESTLTNNELLFPFTTRKDGYEFNTSINGVIGVYFRTIYELSIEVDSQQFKDNISKIIKEEVRYNVNHKENEKNFVDDFMRFSFDNETIKLIDINYYKYMPLQSERENVQKMEIRTGKMLASLFGLNNLNSLEFNSHHEVLNKIYQRGLIESDKNDNVLKVPDFFSTLKGQFEEDIEFCSKNDNFLNKNFVSILIHYYAVYIMQLVIQLDNTLSDMNTLVPIYFAYDDEKLNRDRVASKNGFAFLNQKANIFLYKVYMFVYLNVGQDYTHTLKEISENFSSEDFTYFDEIITILLKLDLKNNRLKNEYIKNVKGSNDLKKYYDFAVRVMRETTVSRAPASRFRNNIVAVIKQYYTKSRGSLGLCLNLTQDQLLTLVAICVKEEKLLIKDLFIEFEKRGVFLDRQSKNVIVEKLENLNLIIKKSDGGEVSYVKSIL